MLYNRLEPNFNLEETQLLVSIFAGGEALGYHVDSVVVTVGEVEVTVRSIQSLCSGFIVDSIAMDAYMELCTRRDEQLSDAYRLINEMKRGYIPRSPTFFLKSNVANLFLDPELSIEDTLAQLPVRIHELLDCYRVVIPYFVVAKDYWILVIIDNSSSTPAGQPRSELVHFVFPRYVDVEQSPTCSDERTALLEAIKQKVGALFVVPHEVQGQGDDQRETTAANLATTQWIYQDPCVLLQAATPLTCNRTPKWIPGRIVQKEDSGLYVMYAVECDYFDAPIFAETDDWTNVRRGFAFRLLNNQLLL